MNEQKVAVVIATKNRPTLLQQRAISSVLNQSKKPDYLVIVDDSLDCYTEQNEIVAKTTHIEACKITYVLNQKTSGASGAWNSAIEHLCSNVHQNRDSFFLAFLDDDDEWHKSYLESCLLNAKKNNSEMVAAGFYRIESSNAQPSVCLPPKVLTEDQFLIGNPGIQGSNLFVSLNAILKAGSFDENLKSCTDRDLCIRICELDTIKYSHIQIPLVNHYADSNRIRLSTPNSESKSSGLQTFWNKYHSRMDSAQTAAFLERAKLLFNWSPKFENSNLKKDVSVEAIKTNHFSLTVGVITGDPDKFIPLLHSITELEQCHYIERLKVIVLCNGCTLLSLNKKIEDNSSFGGNIVVISEQKQEQDAEKGLFGTAVPRRSKGQVEISQARSMLQKYVGLECDDEESHYAWILDDDMRLDNRATSYLSWLPIFKQQGVDVVIGQYEGSSPNPPINGMRCQLVDLVHNLRWLDSFSGEAELPDRSDENNQVRHQYSDYYYDLSRKHTGHLETPLWLEPAYLGESVKDARARLIKNASLIVTGFPLTRKLVPITAKNPIEASEVTYNRGGNTFVLNSKALTQTPNLALKVNERDVRRSDMIWAIINKHHQDLVIKTAPFPVIHKGRVQSIKHLDLDKIKDEIIGSSVYAALQGFLLKNQSHTLEFTEQEKSIISRDAKAMQQVRLERFKLSFVRILGLANVLRKYPELEDLNVFLNSSFQLSEFAKIETQLGDISTSQIEGFLGTLLMHSRSFAMGHIKSEENIEL